MIPLIILAILLGSAAFFFYQKKEELQRELNRLRLYARELEVLRDSEKKNHQELTERFRLLSYEALERTQKKFLEGAEGQLEHVFARHVAPIKETLSRFDVKVSELEKARTGAHAVMSEQIRALLETNGDLRKETRNLVSALRVPHVRGQWGEMQLRRVVELAGMLNHCDFVEQETSENGRLRPDLIIKLPGGKQVIVDAKAPLQNYLDAIATENESEKKLKLAEMAQHLRGHVKALSDKRYWQQFEPTPEFVILFLPGETFFSAALQADPALIEAGVAQRVLLATPTTLIALLHAISSGWRQELLSQNAQEMATQAREVYKRVKDFTGHFSKVGKHLASAVQVYNDAVGSFESRVLSAARRFQESEPLLSSNEIETLQMVEKQTRTLKDSSPTVDQETAPNTNYQK